MKSKIDKLTDRQKTIALLVAQGKTSQEIADQLGLSKFSIETHRKNIYRRLRTKNLAEFVMMVAKKRINFNSGKKLLGEAASKKKLLLLRRKVRELRKENRELKATIERLERKD